MKDFYCNGEEIEVIDMKKIKYGDQVKPVNHRMSTAGEEPSQDQSIVAVKVEEAACKQSERKHIDSQDPLTKRKPARPVKARSGGFKWQRSDILRHRVCRLHQSLDPPDETCA